MAELPEARVIRGGKQLGDPPRRIPPSLRLQLTFGGYGSQTVWAMAAFGTWVPAIILWTSRRHPGDELIRWFVIPWAIGCVVAFGLVMLVRRPKIHLLRFGRETVGRLAAKREIHVGESSVWEYDFVYRDDADREHEVTIRTQLRAKGLEDNTLEAMVYDPSGRRSAVPLDQLPGGPAIVGGELTARRSPWPSLILPLLGITGLVAGIVATS